MNTNKNINPIIQIAYFVFYRFDAFLGNAKDAILLFSLYIVFLSNIYNGYLELKSMEFEHYLVILTKLIFFTHFTYVIVYIINDYFDISRTELAQNVNKLGYELRPLYRNRNLLPVYVTLWCIFVTTICIYYEIKILLVSLCIILLSFLYSLGKPRYRLCFFCLRLLKAVLILCYSKYLISKYLYTITATYDDITVLIASTYSLITGYLYLSKRYACLMSKNLKILTSVVTMSVLIYTIALMIMTGIAYDARMYFIIVLHVLLIGVRSFCQKTLKNSWNIERAIQISLLTLSLQIVAIYYIITM